VKVGQLENLETFIVHQDFLTTISPWARFTLATDNSETPKKVFMTETTSAVFKIFMEWLYSRQMPLKAEDCSWDLISQLYAFATRYDVPHLRDVTMTLAWHKRHYLVKMAVFHPMVPFPERIIAQAFDTLDPKSAFCRFIRDMWIFDQPPEKVENMNLTKFFSDRAANKFLQATLVEIKLRWSQPGQTALRQFPPYIEYLEMKKN
jgi:hypothetical protein